LENFKTLISFADFAFIVCMSELIREIRRCTLCAAFLPLGPKPILSGSRNSKIAIVSQAPGRIAHESGIPFMDQSGKNLRAWLGVDEATFYNEKHFAIAPMGFCYPGKGKGGDLPPRPECAPTWHDQLFSYLKNLDLKLLIGQYSQKQYLGSQMKKNLTETVRYFEDYLPEYFPLPHPSPRNGIWMRKNPWFEEEVLPALREKVAKIISQN
jgi:uracil-DNA glycosylase